MLTIKTYQNKDVKKMEKGDEYFQNIEPTWKNQIIGELLKIQK